MHTTWLRFLHKTGRTLDISKTNQTRMRYFSTRKRKYPINPPFSTYSLNHITNSYNHVFHFQLNKQRVHLVVMLRSQVPRYAKRENDTSPVTRHYCTSPIFQKWESCESSRSQYARTRGKSSQDPAPRTPWTLVWYEYNTVRLILTVQWAGPTLHTRTTRTKGTYRTADGGTYSYVRITILLAHEYADCTSQIRDPRILRAQDIIRVLLVQRVRTVRQTLQRIRTYILRFYSRMSTRIVHLKYATPEYSARHNTRTVRLLRHQNILCTHSNTRNTRIIRILIHTTRTDS